MSKKELTVVATAKGVYGGDVRTPGTASGTFQLEDPKHFSKRWMAHMDENEAKAFHDNVQRKREIDHLTGERIASGGVNEALAIALEENQKLKTSIAEMRSDANSGARVAELEAEVEALKEELRLYKADHEAEAARKETGLEEGDVGEEAEAAPEKEAEVDDTASDEDTETTQAPVRRRRRQT